LRPGPEDEHDDYPVPQVRALPVPPRPTTLGASRNRIQATRKSNPEKDDDDGSALPRVASTSTVLASIGTKTSYVGPSLLRSRQLGMKRSLSSSGDSKEGGGTETAKKPRSESSATSAGFRWCYSTHFLIRVLTMGARKKGGAIPRAVQGTVELGGDVDGKTTDCLELGSCTRRHYQRRAEDIISDRSSNGCSYTVSRR
jgi:hypothetical protein